MPGWSTSEGITVPSGTLSADAGIALQQNFQILGSRSAAILGPCRAASTANVSSLSGTTTIDGVVLAAGDRVLLTQQTTQNQNGPWVVQSSGWTRPQDFNSGMVFTTGGLLVPVLGGTVNGGQIFTLGVYSASGPVSSGSGNLTVGTTDLGAIKLPPPGIAAVVDDTSPELGGNLNADGFSVTELAGIGMNDFSVVSLSSTYPNQIYIQYNPMGNNVGLVCVPGTGGSINLASDAGTNISSGLTVQSGITSLDTGLIFTDGIGGMSMAGALIVSGNLNIGGLVTIPANPPLALSGVPSIALSTITTIAECVTALQAICTALGIAHS